MINYPVFMNVMNQFNNGQGNFNRGTTWAFLYDQKWYPVKAFMETYNAQIGMNSPNTHTSVFQLSNFFPVITAQITFENRMPVSVN
jgi:hypothetical protein